jgi:DNA-binding transcriptional LysR family regulator
MALLDELDLNLLRVLDAVLRHRSVSAAAKELGRSQPATSHALARLRDALGDPLLVRQGRALEPTPRAEALQDSLTDALEGLRRLLERDGFDPATASVTFTVACPDALAVGLPPLLTALSDAPGIRLQVLPEDHGRADVYLGPMPQEAPGFVARRLGVLDQVVLLRRGHPALDDPWSLEAYTTRWPHVLVGSGKGSTSIVEIGLAAAGARREVGLVVPSFLLAPHVVADSDLLFTSARQICVPLARRLGLAVRPPPLPLPTVTVAAWWSERWHADAAHRWFRDRLCATLTAVLQHDAQPDSLP